MEEIDSPSSYFLDSYALIEIVNENGNYKKFGETINFTGFMNLLEVHSAITREFGAEKADSIIDKFKELSIDIEINDVKEASKFKLKNAKKKFSYVDCISYAMAFNRKMKFVTGDREFEGVHSVEFVK